MHTSIVVIGLVFAGLHQPVFAQATGKAPSTYNAQEREAVEVVKGWINAWRAYDLEKLMSYMDDKLVFRGDPIEPLRGREAFRKMAQGVIKGWSGMDIEEIYPVGSETETIVLFKRVDYFPGDTGFFLRGMAIPVAVMMRIKNGKVTEYLDAPLIPVGPGAPLPPGVKPMPGGGLGNGVPPPGAPKPPIN
jgi:SnoaL-like domain